MKRGESLLIGLLAISGASADSLDLRPPPHAPQGASISDRPVQISSAGLGARRQRGRQATGGRLAHLKDDMVQEVRATTTFVQEQANNAGSRSRWLTALAGCGLVMLQLRRKHKSLPQRRIAPYG
jgi:hypothetical protein